MLLVKPYILYKKANKPVTLGHHSPNSEVESNEGLLNATMNQGATEHDEHEVRFIS
jgi:hypothetical protein